MLGRIIWVAAMAVLALVTVQLQLDRQAAREPAYLQPAILGLPVVDHRFRDPMPAGQISCLRARLSLLQHPDNLLF
jgi:hypothetical protein